MAENFIQYLRFEKRYAEHTVQAYQADIAQFTSFLKDLGIEQLFFIKTPQVRLWVVSLMECACSPASIRRKLSALNTYYKFAIRKGLTEHNPAKGISLPKLPSRLPKYIEEHQLDLLMKSSSAFSDDFSGQRDRMIIEVLYSTGIRRQELVNLRWPDVNEASMTMKVLGKGNKERIIPISRALLEQLHVYKSLCSDTFQGHELPDRIILSNKGTAAYPELVYKTVKKHLSLCSTQEKKSPHVLRHSFATHMSNHGAPLNDIKELLGHASLASTQVYTHNTIEQLKEVYKIAHPKA
jgi:integrase/recombinase XerC